VSRAAIEVSQKLYERLQAESARTGDPVDIIAEQAILRVLAARRPDTKTSPKLWCNRCGNFTPHTFVRGQNTFGGGQEQIYSCEPCGRPRRWGLLGPGAKDED
jgi:methionyl-tRNA synthetase